MAQITPASRTSDRLRPGAAALGATVHDATPAAGAEIVLAPAAADAVETARERADGAASSIGAKAGGARVRPSVDKARSGLDALLAGRATALRPRPMLDIALERFAHAARRRFAGLGQPEPMLHYLGMRCLDMAAYVEEIWAACPVLGFHAMPSGAACLLRFERPLLLAILDHALGGSRCATPVHRRNQAPTLIETRLIERFAGQLLAELSAVLAPYGLGELRLDRLEHDARNSELAAGAGSCVMAAFAVDLSGSPSRLELVVPETVLESLSDLLTRNPATHPPAHPSGWQLALEQLIRATEVELDARLDERKLSFKTVADLRVGTTLDLALSPDAPVRLVCSGLTVALGRIAHEASRMVVAIDKALPTHQDAADDQPDS